MGKNISAIVAHAAVILAIIITLGLVGAFMSGADAGAGSEKFTGELEQGAVLKVLENDTAKRQGYFDELLAAFNEEYAQYGIRAEDANLSESTDLEQDGPYGYGPDVLYQENDKLMRYVDGRHILPLPVNDIECFDEVSETAWKAFLADDGSGSQGVFAVPVNVQGPLLYYRKDLLPENWQQEWDDDGDGICDILQYWTDMYRFSLQRKEESGGKQFGYMRSFLEPYFSLGYLYSYGGYTFGNDNTDPSDIGHSAGEAEKGAYIIKQLAGAMDERCIDDSVTTGAYSAIASGEFFATITTPDVYTMFVDEMKAAAEEIAKLGCGAVLVKGGHLGGEPDVITDVLYADGKMTLFEDKRIDTTANHGTGCTLSSAIAAELAAGCGLEEAVTRARLYLRAGLHYGVTAGHGAGCLGHAVTMPWTEIING